MSEEQTTSIEVHCMTCGKFLRTQPGEGVEGVSHGICDECLLLWLVELGIDDAEEGTQ